ncbi:MAG: DUF5518 domain-containing protein [Methanobacterium sp. ERen5]|nr:MAG: DUF5518 domain-containing protein [Methanobacterium sp. ERen5]
MAIIYLPLAFIGPITGGFLVSYLSKGYEDYNGIDWKDGAVVGAISGLIGGLILALLFTWFGTLNVALESFTGNNLILLFYVTIQITVLLSFILGLIGGVVGAVLRTDSINRHFAKFFTLYPHERSIKDCKHFYLCFCLQNIDFYICYY